MEASSTRGKKCKTSANGLKWALIAAMAENNKSGPQSAFLRTSKLQDKDKKAAHTEWQLHLPTASVFVHLNTINLQTAKKTKFQFRTGNIYTSKLVVGVKNWWNQEEIGTVTFPHTFSQCDVDSGSSALSSSAWRRRWPVPSLGSTGQDSDAPSLESQIVGV